MKLTNEPMSTIVDIINKVRSGDYKLYDDGGTGVWSQWSANALQEDHNYAVIHKIDYKLASDVVDILDFGDEDKWVIECYDPSGKNSEDIKPKEFFTNYEKEFSYTLKEQDEKVIADIDDMDELNEFFGNIRRKMFEATSLKHIPEDLMEMFESQNPHKEEKLNTEEFEHAVKKNVKDIKDSATAVKGNIISIGKNIKNIIKLI